MEMTLNYSGAFCELGYDELEDVNGGSKLGSRCSLFCDFLVTFAKKRTSVLWLYDEDYLQYMMDTQNGPV